MNFGVSTKMALTKRESYIMKKLAVIHTAFEDSPRTVAFVDVPELPSVNEMLEYAYRWTNNVMGSWSIKEEYFEDGSKNGDYNPNVTVMAPLEDGMGIRSTSVGDQILVGNTKYKVASCGFEKI